MRLVQALNVTEPQVTLVTRADRDGDIMLHLITTDGRDIPLGYFTVRAGKLKGVACRIAGPNRDLVHVNEINGDFLVT